MERMLGFYRDLLGFEVTTRGEMRADRPQFGTVVGQENASATVCFLKFGNAYLELFQYHTPEGRPPEPDRPVVACGIAHLCIDVDDVDAEYARLAAAGVKFISTPQTMGRFARAVYSRDPDDNIVEFQQVLEKGEAFMAFPPR